MTGRLRRGTTGALRRLRRNPLRRRSDVAEAWTGVAAVVVLLVLVPVVGVVTAAVGEGSALGRAKGLNRTSARLVEDAPAVPSRFSGPAQRQVRATVRWTLPDGSTRTAAASVPVGAEAGSSTTVWLDGAGRPRPAPPTPAQARVQGRALGAAAGAGVGLSVVGTWWAVRTRLDARRGAQWDRAWAEFDADRGHRHA